MIVDKFGLAVENQGDFRADQSGIISSLMRNVATLSQAIKSADRYVNTADWSAILACVHSKAPWTMIT